jgi:phosphohistidine phosphatase
MRIDLLRHAEAADGSPTGRDADRPLTESGLRRMKSVAKAFAKLECNYDAILISPLVRARQTAEPVAAACRFANELIVTEALLPNADPDAILEELVAMGHEAVLLVGHQPHMGRLFGRLLAGNQDFEVPMKKAAFAAFETHGSPVADRAELRYYLSPKLLEKLA